MEKIILITGASKGIGKQIAEVFAKNGYSLILTARTTAELEQLQKHLINKYQCEAKVISADLSRPEGVDFIMNACQEEMHNIEVLVNNAGYGIAKKLTDIANADIAGMIDVDIAALTELTYRILPFMTAKKRGKILNVSSIAAFGPGPYMSIYYAAKAYVLLFSEGIREEYRDDGINISVLCPGVTITEFQKRAGMERLFLTKILPMSAEKVAQAAYKGLMKNKRIIIPGAGNKIMRVIMYLTPNWLIAKITGMLQKSTKI